MSSVRETTFKLKDGQEVFMKTWESSTTPLAKVVFVHGLNDHVDRYFELFPTLASKGISVVSWDQRGWGKSVKTEAEKGLTGPTTLVISDIVDVVKAQLPSSVPLFLMGHSMGGAEVVTLASMPEYQYLMPSIRGILLESPHIGFPKGKEPNILTVLGGRLLGKLVPRQQMHCGLPPDTLTRDPEVVKSLKEDKLLHDLGTLEGLAGLLDRQANIEKGHVKLNDGVQAIWLAHGTADYATGYDASKKWFDERTENVQDKTFKSYDGWSHQLHADKADTRSIFANDVADWISERAREAKAGQTKL